MTRSDTTNGRASRTAQARRKGGSDGKVPEMACLGDFVLTSRIRLWRSAGVDRPDGNIAHAQSIENLRWQRRHVHGHRDPQRRGPGWGDAGDAIQLDLG